MMMQRKTVAGVLGAVILMSLLAQSPQITKPVLTDKRRLGLAVSYNVFRGHEDAFLDWYIKYADGAMSALLLYVDAKDLADRGNIYNWLNDYLLPTFTDQDIHVFLRLCMADIFDDTQKDLVISSLLTLADHRCLKAVCHDAEFMEGIPEEDDWRNFYNYNYQSLKHRLAYFTDIYYRAYANRDPPIYLGLATNISPSEVEGVTPFPGITLQGGVRTLIGGCQGNWQYNKDCWLTNNWNNTGHCFLDLSFQGYDSCPVSYVSYQFYAVEVFVYPWRGESLYQYDPFGALKVESDFRRNFLSRAGSYELSVYGGEHLATNQCVEAKINGNVLTTRWQTDLKDMDGSILFIHVQFTKKDYYAFKGQNPSGTMDEFLKGLLEPEYNAKAQLIAQVSNLNILGRQVNW